MAHDGMTFRRQPFAGTLIRAALGWNRLWYSAFALAALGLGSSPISAQDPGSAPDTLVGQVQRYLAVPAAERGTIASQPWAQQPLQRAEAIAIANLLADDRLALLRQTHAREWEARTIELGELRMPFTYRIFGTPPASGRSLFISLHGGGEMPAEVNDRQWENQKRLYEPSEGVYLVPRAPTNSWNMWHQPHIDQFFARLIEDASVFEGVDPNRVYLLGYSAGGDGVFQLAPRMADRLAAASMMAGHPNETSPLGLRNLPFTLHMGEKDAAFNRNQIAGQWRDALDQLQREDPEGYPHHVEIHPGKGHWMDREDRVAIPWLAQYTRNPFPQRVVWKQDDVTHERFYWLGVPSGTAAAGSLVKAQVAGNTIEIEQAEGVERLYFWLNDALLDLDQPCRVVRKGQVLWEGKVPRTAVAIGDSLAERDRTAVATATLEVSLVSGPSR